MASKIDFRRKEVQEALRKGVASGLTKVTLSLQRRIRKKLNKPGTGKFYGDHQASAADGKSPPAKKSGNLANSWIAATQRGPVKHDKGIGIALRPAEVGGATKYGFWLEYGTTRMVKRPYIRPSVQQLNRNKRAVKIVENQLVRHIAFANRMVN